MTINQVVVTALIAGFAVGVVMGLVLLTIDRRKIKKPKVFSAEKGITLGYGAPQPQRNRSK